MYDIKIVNGSIPNFRTGELDHTNIGIKEGKIVAIGQLNEASNSIIDALDCIVSPGFIDVHMHEDRLDDKRENIDFDISNHMLKMGVTTCVGGNCGISFDGLEGLRQFKQSIKRNGSPVNYLMFAGYTSIREACGVIDRYKTSTESEQLKIQDHFGAYLNEGVIGLSFGLEYAPGTSEQEVTNICSRYKDILVSAHFRSDGKDSVHSMNELITLSKENDLKVKVSHIGSCAAIGYMEESLEVLDKAVNEGIKIDADCYPYDAFSTHIGSAVFDEGWQTSMNASYEDLMVLEEPFKNQICDEALFKKLRSEYSDHMVLASVMNEHEIIMAYERDYVSVASDGILNHGQGHPRAVGTFPRVLGRYVRDKKVIDIVTALKKMSLQNAKWLGLKHKGEIKVGYDADITIFDPNTINDKATYTNAKLVSEGIKYVLLNGEIALKNNTVVNDRLGQFIERSDCDG